MLLRHSALGGGETHKARSVDSQHRQPLSSGITGWIHAEDERCRTSERSRSECRPLAAARLRAAHTRCAGTGSRATAATTKRARRPSRPRALRWQVYEIGCCRFAEWRSLTQPQLSSPAKAGDPVFRAGKYRGRAYGRPAGPGDDSCWCGGGLPHRHARARFVAKRPPIQAIQLACGLLRFARRRKAYSCRAAYTAEPRPCRSRALMPS